MDATREVKELIFDAIGDEDDVHSLVRNLAAAGYSIVPSAPTDAALKAGQHYAGDPAALRACYRAMVAASAVKP